ncbi:uncharacterized protein [Anoplolepis gracilipes]|uniref:uncharacterized protein n=1 Tax=Anoplolepis gracilipes TaxID=354296 RepID=UPI003B9E5F60
MLQVMAFTEAMFETGYRHLRVPEWVPYRRYHRRALRRARNMARALFQAQLDILLGNIFEIGVDPIPGYISIAHMQEVRWVRAYRKECAEWENLWVDNPYSHELDAEYPHMYADIFCLHRLFAEEPYPPAPAFLDAETENVAVFRILHRLFGEEPY